MTINWKLLIGALGGAAFGFGFYATGCLAGG
jgi:hypothetical protein